MINKVILIGRCTEPETRHTENNQFSSFSLATSEKYKNKAGELIENTDWHNVVVWGKLSEIVEKYVKKGTLLYIEGKLKTRSWEDKEGNKRYTTEVVLSGFDSVLKMLSKVGENSTQQGSESNNQESTPPENEEEDLPF